MSKTAYYEVTYNLAHPGGACLTSEGSGTFLSSDFTPTRQGGHAVTVELIGARVLVYFDGANCRISGGVLKRGCFPKGEDEKDSWGSVRTWRPLDLWRSNGGVDQLEQESGILGSS